MRAIKAHHVEALAKVLTASGSDLSLATAVEENLEMLGELMRIIRVVSLGMPDD